MPSEEGIHKNSCKALLSKCLSIKFGVCAEWFGSVDLYNQVQDTKQFQVPTSL